MKTLKGILLLLFVAFGLSTVQAQLKGTETLITVADEKVSVDEFLYVYQKNNPSADAIDQNDLKEYLDLYVNFRLKVKEAKALGLDTLTSFKKELEGYRKQLAQPYFKDTEMEQFLLEQAYERKLTDIRASHILIKLDKNASPEDTLTAYNRAIELRNQYLKEKDFSALAALNSDDPSAKDVAGDQAKPGRKGNHGDLGYFTVFDMVYPFENGAYNTKVNEVSMPVRTDYGYHLIYVTDRQPAMGQAQVAHIYVAHPKSSEPADSLKARQKIDSAYNALVSGEKFEDVVKKYSEDKGSVSIGGKLPWFGVNRMVPEFIITTRTLENPGDYSEPFQTVFGWHIITLLERKPVGTFEEEKLGLQNRLNKDRRISLSEENVINRIKKEYGFKEYPEAKEKLFATLDTTLLKGQWDAQKAEDLNKTLVTIGDKKYSQYDFAKIIAEKQNDRITDITAFFNDTYAKFVHDICIEYEDNMLAVKYPEFKRLVQEYHDGILLFDLTDKKVWSKAVKDTTGLQNYYNNHKDSYMWGERVEAVVYLVSNNSSVKIEAVQSKAKQKLSVDEILGTFNVDSVTNVTAERGFFSKGDNEIIDQVEWHRGISNIIPTKRGLAFADILEVINPMPKSLDEARGLITADYQAFLEEEWIKELKSKYPVSIDQEILSQIK